MAEIDPFPDSVTLAGPTPNKQLDFVPDYEVIRYRFDNGGGAVNVRPCGPVRVTLEYDGLTSAEATLLDAHFASAKGKTNTFDYFDRRAGITYENCRYENYEIVTHEKYWIRARRIVIVREA